MRKLGITLCIILLLVVAVAGSIFWQIPSDSEIKGCLVTKMYGVHLCPGGNDYVALKNISPYLQKAVVLTEDSNFFNHKGFDWESIEKSARENWEKGQYKRGGSTITQQLAKNMFLSKEKSLFRKGLEAIITERIEKNLKKKDILERYLNVVEFGKDIYGVKQASQFYFHKTPAQLTVVESAFLAMLLPSPEKYSRSFFKKELSNFAHKRIAQIIESMYRYNRIDQTEYDVAMTEIDRFLREGQAEKTPETMQEDTTTMEQMDTPPSEDEDNFF